jgi:uncharacterized membrane-anchored protein
MCSLRNLFSLCAPGLAGVTVVLAKKGHSPLLQKGPCMRRLAAILTLSACASLAYAEEPAQPAATEESDTPAPEERDPELVKLESSLSFKTGDVVVGDNLATLHLKGDTERVLVAWGNPPGNKSLGMLLPDQQSPFDESSWAVLVSYSEDGHVDDEDAKDIDFNDTLAEMKKDTEEANEQRTKDGYPVAHLVGWAEPPHYDNATRKLYWAKELDFGSPEHTLNYDIRVLGRKGVLELSAIASLTQLSVVKAEMPKVLGAVEFNKGSRYADFNPDMDSMAAYGIGALIAGKVAAKVGLFKVIVAALIASKKLLLAGGVAVAMFIKKLFGKKSEEAPSETPPA